MMFDGNNQNQNYFGQGGFNAYNGYGVAQAQPIKNALTEEEIKSLQQTQNTFSLGITERDALRAKCTHRKPGGMEDSLVFDQNTGTVRCLICGYEFRPIEADTSLETISDSVANIVDILQTIKILFPTLPADAVGEFFQIIPLLEKVPELFKLAVKEFAKGDVNAWSYSSNNMGGAAMFANLMNAFGNGFMPGPQQMAQPVQPMANPFGYAGASQQPAGYVPTTPAGYAFQPTQVPTQPTVSAPAAPVAPEVPMDTVATTVNA